MAIDPAKRSEKNAARINAATAASQEVKLAKVRNKKRRDGCRNDLRKFALTYCAAAVYLGLAPYQEEMLAAFQDVLIDGGKKCRAVRRGGLKSTLARIAAAWAILYGHRKFVVLVGATDDKSNENRDNFFKMLATSKKLREDFPEVAPLLLKWKNPKKQLRLNGDVLSVSAKDERGCVLFPAIEGVESSEARVAPYSILATDVSGLSFVDDTGKTVRPDAILFDDVQTPQSAKSAIQTDSRENAVTTTFLGLAGLGETMAAIMVCTARETGDLTARFCDRERHPDWDGRKYPVLVQEPTEAEYWEQYGVLLRGGDTPKQGFQNATDFYKAHRAIMDKNGKAAWEKDKERGYVSALQWCMTIKILQPEYFRSELQQEGALPVNRAVQLSADVILRRTSAVPRGIVPAGASYLTAMVDSSDEILWWMVCAWSKDFTGWIVDFGSWPNQGRQQFYKDHLQHTISRVKPSLSWEEAFVHAHNELEQQLLQAWPAEEGPDREVDLILKDWNAPKHSALIACQTMASLQKTRIRLSRGKAPKPGRKPVHLWGKPKVDRHAFADWVEKRSESPRNVLFDANMWKSFTASRLRTVVGAPSCLLLPDADDAELTLLVEHLTAEKAVDIAYEGVPGVAYEQIPNRDNDWWDCLIGNSVAASMLGCTLTSQQRPKPRAPVSTGPRVAKYF